MPANDSISVYQGEDLTLNFTMDPVENITGWTLEFNVRSAASVVIQKTPVVTSGPAGTFTVSLVDADTNHLTPGVFMYDVWRIDVSTERILAVGNFTLLAVARTPTDDPD